MLVMFYFLDYGFLYSRPVETRRLSDAGHLVNNMHQVNISGGGFYFIADPKVIAQKACNWSLIDDRNVIFF